MMDPSMMGGPQGAPPPDLAALLGGGGGAPAPEAPPAEPDPSQHITSPSAGDNSDNLRNAIMFIQAYMEGETDDQDLALATKILSQAQGLLATQQQLMDKATGAGPGARVVRKATQASGGSTGYGG